MMKIQLRFRLGIALFASVLIAPNLSADVFRSVDADGNVTYSDTPHDGAKKIVIQKPTIIPSVRSTTKLTPNKPQNGALPYKTIKIVSPAEEETLRNIQSVSVSAQLSPSLQTRFGHQASFLFNGSPVGEPSSRLNVTIGQIERGAHTVKVVVLDRDGKTVAQSPATQFFVHKNSIQQRQGQGQGQGGS